MELCNALGRVDDADPAQHAVRQEALEAIADAGADHPACLRRALARARPRRSVAGRGLARGRRRRADPDSLTLVVQVNGKVRARIDVPADADRDTVAAAARADDNVARFVDGQPIKKTIVVPGKLVNLVV